MNLVQTGIHYNKFALKIVFLASCSFFVINASQYTNFVHCENSGISHNVIARRSCTSIRFDIILLLLLLLLLCWSAALETRSQPVFRNRETDSLHQTATLWQQQFQVFWHFCILSLVRHFISTMNWQQNGIACIAIFGCLHTSPPKSKTRTGPKWEMKSYRTKKKNKFNKKNTLREQYLLSVYVRSVMTPVELSRPKQLLVNIFY